MNDTNEQMDVVQDVKAQIMENYTLIKLEQAVLDFDMNIYDPVQNDVMISSINQYEGKWLVLVFYPADFTFVCPTELKELNDIYADIKLLEDVELLVVSTDTVFTHKMWIHTEPLLTNFKIPMVSDRTTVLSRYFGILNEESGNAERGTFVISSEGILKSKEVITEPVGRSAHELLRKIKALRYVNEHPDEACPASWNEEKQTIKPGLDIVGGVGDNYEIK